MEWDSREIYSQKMQLPTSVAGKKNVQKTVVRNNM